MSTIVREVMVPTKWHIKVCDQCHAEAETAEGWFTVYPRTAGVPITTMSSSVDLCSPACMTAYAESMT